MATAPLLSGPIRADDVAETALELEALERLRAVTGESDGPMERHGLRCYLICLRLASLRGAEVDRELLLVAALLHDIGLYEGASEGGVYVSDGAAIRERAARRPRGLARRARAALPRRDRAPPRAALAVGGRASRSSCCAAPISSTSPPG